MKTSKRARPIFASTKSRIWDTYDFRHMKNDLLMYVGAGLLVGSAVLGIAVGIAYTLRAKIETFKYGVFYSVFAMVASIGYCLASIAWFFNFLGPRLQLPIFCSLVSLGFLAGLIVMVVFIKKDNRWLFAILSLYTLFVVWLTPVFVWNMIYLIFVARRPKPNPDNAVQSSSAQAV
jgi:hypothetical protein